MPTHGLSLERLHEFAKAGAKTTLKQLRAEMMAVERTFPELAIPKRRRQLRKSLEQARTRTRRFSAAAREAISRRMTRYWAERRKARARVK